MDDDEREFGDNDAQADMAEAREMRRRANWVATDSDPFPDWEDESGSGS